MFFYHHPSTSNKLDIFVLLEGFLFKIAAEAGKMAQQFRTIVALAKDLDLSSRTHVVDLQLPAVTQVPRDPTFTLSYYLWAPAHMS